MLQNETNFEFLEVGITTDVEFKDLCYVVKDIVQDGSSIKKYLLISKVWKIISSDASFFDF